MIILGKYYDAHAHLGGADEQYYREKFRIATFLCGTDPKSAAMVAGVCRESTVLIPTYGLHPWHADKYEVEEMLPYLRQGELLGEIGMDSVWCQVDLGRQREVFIRQLKLAAAWDMPVILHTKGQEREILTCIEPYSMPILVHWYSAMQSPEGYVRKDCFFSIGPDLRFNPAVRQAAALAAPERLLVETDGMAAVRWAASQGESGIAAENQYLPDILRGLVEEIAQLKGLPAAAMEAQIAENFEYLRNYRRFKKVRC